MLKMHQECGSLELVLNHPDIAPVKRDPVGVYRLMCAFMTCVPASHLPGFAHQALRLKNIDERNSVVEVLVQHVFASHAHNTPLINQIFQNFLYSPNINLTTLHSWMKRGHQSLAKEYWQHSLGDDRIYCEENMFRYLKVCSIRNLDVRDFLDFIPLFNFTEDKAYMVSARLLEEYSNGFRNENLYQSVLNSLEQLQNQHPENLMVTASLRQYFSMLPPKEQERYQNQCNIQMQERLNEVVGQNHGQQRKRKL